MFIFEKKYNFINENCDIFLLNKPFIRKEWYLFSLIFSIFIISSLSAISYLSSDGIFDAKITYINNEKIPYSVLVEVENNVGEELELDFEILYGKENLVLGSESIDCNQDICEVKVPIKKVFFEELQLHIYSSYEGDRYLQSIPFLLEKKQSNNSIFLNPNVEVKPYEIPFLEGTLFLERAQENVIFRIFPQGNPSKKIDEVIACDLECDFSINLSKDLEFGKYQVQVYLPDDTLSSSFVLFSKDLETEVVKENLSTIVKINSSGNEVIGIDFQGREKVLEVSEDGLVDMDEISKLDRETQEMNSYKVKLSSKDKLPSKKEIPSFTNVESLDNLSNQITNFSVGFTRMAENFTNNESFLLEKPLLENNLTIIEANISESNDLQGSSIQKDKEIIFEDEKIYFDQGKKLIEVNDSESLSQRKLQPGIYTYEKITRYEDGSEEVEQDSFAYGLISINTKKPLYKENEVSEMLIVVLDKWGFLVDDAQITLEVTKPSNETLVLTSQSGQIFKTENIGVYETSLLTDEIGEYSLYAQVELEDMIVDITSFFNVVESYPFDIIRDVPVTIDPWLGPFRNDFDISNVDSRYVGEFDLIEVVSSDFEINETNANIYYSENDTMYLKWFNITSDFEPYYVAQVPLVTPYLYYLGNSWIEYENRVFYENRSWLFAIDPAAQVCGSESPCICGAGCRVGDGLDTPVAGDQTIDTTCNDGNKEYEWVDDIIVRNLNGSYFGVGDTIEICIDVTCDTAYNGDRASIGYKGRASDFANSDVIFQTGTTGDATACIGIQQYCTTQTLTNYVGAHHVRASVVYQGFVNRICHEPTYRDHDDVEFEVLDKVAPILLSWNLENGTSVGNNLNVIRGNIINSTVLWDLPLQSGSLTHNGDGSVVEYLVDTVDQNSTLTSLDTSDTSLFSSIGPVTISQTSANDLYFNLRGNSSITRTFDIIAELGINQTDLIPNVGYEGINTTISCQFVDANIPSTTYSGLEVQFFQDGVLLGSNFTDSSGRTSYSFTENTIGEYNISCVGQSSLVNYFQMSSQDSGERTLFVRANNTDITIPVITNVSISSPTFSIGGVTTISANVTDNVLVDNVQVEVTFPDFSKSTYLMSNIGADLYAFNFSDTLQDGVYRYVIIGEDNSSNPAFSSTKNFEVVGVRAFIGIQSQQNIFKLGESLNLSSFNKVEDITTTTYTEEGDVSFFYYDFDSSVQGWTTGGAQNEWERGVPSTAFNNNCDSGNCYAIDLNGNYNNNANQWLRSPLFDFTGRTNIRATYWRALELQDGTTTDRAFFEGSNNAGGSWTVYFQDSLIGTGGLDYELQDGTSSYLLPELDDQSDSYVRFRLTSNANTVRDGWTVDSVNISFNPRVDWENDWNIIDSSFGSDVDKITAIKLGFNITNYNSSGSNTLGNPSPDIEVQIFDGTSYSGSFLCNLDDTIFYPHYCEVIVKNIPTYLDPWTNANQRNIRFRAINMDQSDSIEFTNVKREYVTPSIVENNGEGQLTAYLLQQFKNSTGGIVETLNFDPISINPGEARQLSDFWTYSIAGNFQLGNYTAYVALTDASGNVLQNEDDGSFINDSYPFTIQSLIINYLNPSEILNNTESFRINITLDTSSYGFGGWCGYSLNGAANVTMSNPSFNYLEAFVNNFPDGNHQIEIFCDDSDGDIVTSGVRNFVVSEPPRINFLAPTPANNSINPISTFDVNVSIEDTTFDSAWLEFEGENLSLSCTLNSGISYYCNGSTGIKNGIYSYRVCANDSLDNINCTGSRTIQINAPLPVLTLLSPLNNSKIFLGDELNITLDSTLPLDLAWYSIAGIVINDTLSPLSSTLWEGYRNLTTGRYDLYVEVNDSYDNRVNLSHVFYVLPDKHVRVSKSIILPGNDTIIINSSVENFGFWQNYTYAEFSPSPFSRISSSNPEDFSEVVGLDTLYYYDLSLPINSTFDLQSHYQRTLLGNAEDFFSVFVD